METKQQAEDRFIKELDVAVSTMVKKYPDLDRLNVYNALQTLSRMIGDRMSNEAGDKWHN